LQNRVVRIFESLAAVYVPSVDPVIKAMVPEEQFQNVASKYITKF